MEKANMRSKYQGGNWVNVMFVLSSVVCNEEVLDSLFHLILFIYFDFNQLIILYLYETFFIVICL